MNKWVNGETRKRPLTVRCCVEEMQAILEPPQQALFQTPTDAKTKARILMKKMLLALTLTIPHQWWGKVSSHVPWFDGLRLRHMPSAELLCKMKRQTQYIQKVSEKKTSFYKIAHIYFSETFKSWRQRKFQQLLRNRSGHDRGVGPTSGKPREL